MFCFFPKTASCCDLWTWQGSSLRAAPGSQQLNHETLLDHSRHVRFEVLLWTQGVPSVGNVPLLLLHPHFFAFTAACNLCKENKNPVLNGLNPQSPLYCRPGNIFACARHWPSCQKQRFNNNQLFLSLIALLNYKLIFFPMRLRVIKFKPENVIFLTSLPPGNALLVYRLAALTGLHLLSIGGPLWEG